MIVIESREPNDVKAWGDAVLYSQYGDITLKVTSYMGAAEYVIERKTPTDYLSSLHEGRLNQQLVGCNALLIDLRRHGLDIPRYFYDVFSHIDSKTDITLEFFNKVNGTALHHPVIFGFSDKHIVTMLRRYEVKLRDGDLGKLRIPVVKKSDIHPSVRVLAEFDGIGIERATSMLKVYKSLDGVLNAAADMETMPGIGPATLEKINERMKEEVKL